MPCSHKNMIQITQPDTEVCKDCVALSDEWVHLRMCMTCGYVGCCDSSKNKHARAHYETTGHPIIRSVEPGETWRYCYIDTIIMKA